MEPVSIEMIDKGMGKHNAVICRLEQECNQLRSERDKYKEALEEQWKEAHDKLCVLGDNCKHDKYLGCEWPKPKILKKGGV